MLSSRAGSSHPVSADQVLPPSTERRVITAERWKSR
jgi:hypothetical protein